MKNARVRVNQTKYWSIKSDDFLFDFQMVFDIDYIWQMAKNGGKIRSKQTQLTLDCPGWMNEWMRIGGKKNKDRTFSVMKWVIVIGLAAVKAFKKHPFPMVHFKCSKI